MKRNCVKISTGLFCVMAVLIIVGLSSCQPKATAASTQVIEAIEKKDTEQRPKSAQIAEIQKKIDSQFRKINKSGYTLVGTEESIMRAMFGIGGSSYEVGKRYKTLVIAGVNTKYGATYTNSIQSFVDPDKKVIPELTEIGSEYYIYFKVNKISGNDHYVTLEYIDFSE